MQQNPNALTRSLAGSFAFAGVTVSRGGRFTKA